MPDRRDPMMPGGDEAVEQGCLCPVMDNGHGNVDLARDRGGWWIASDCPLHGVGGTTPAEVPAQPGSVPIVRSGGASAPAPLAAPSPRKAAR